MDPLSFNAFLREQVEQLKQVYQLKPVKHRWGYFGWRGMAGCRPQSHPHFQIMQSRLQKQQTWQRRTELNLS